MLRVTNCAISTVAGERGRVSGVAAGARALGVALVMMPPGTRGMPHFRVDRETALYMVSGELEVWHGPALAQRSLVRAGDLLRIPPGAPHLTVNRGDVTSIAVAGRDVPGAGASDSDAIVMVELPRHLAGVLCLPVAAD